MPRKWILNFDSSLAHNESIVFLCAGSPLLRYTGYIVPIQELNQLKSRLSLHCYGTESEEKPQMGILIFTTSIQFLNNESFIFLSAGSR